jgi:hypothetical protein
MRASFAAALSPVMIAQLLGLESVKAQCAGVTPGFDANPTNGGAPLTVDLISQTSFSNDNPVTFIQWFMWERGARPDDPDDPETYDELENWIQRYDADTPPADQPLTTNGVETNPPALTQGIWTVAMRVQLESGDWCPPLNAIPYRRDDYITVSAGGEVDDPPAADFEAIDLIRDQEGLLPLSDWVPLFNFTLSYGDDEDGAAPRWLEEINFRIKGDGRDPNDLSYLTVSGLDPSDILEFGIFQESHSDEAEWDNLLDGQNDSLLWTFDAYGGPGEVGQLVEGILGGGPLEYNLDFIGNGGYGGPGCATGVAPQFPVDSAAAGDDGFAGNSYIVALRTSATFRSMLSLNVEVLNARMVEKCATAGAGGAVDMPRNEEGELIDSYSPDFYGDDPETLDEESSYFASFAVWDISGSLYGDQNIGYVNSWNHPAHLYIPLAEHTRPTWNGLGTFMDSFGGEILELRNLVAVEDFVPVIGINAHSTHVVHAGSEPDATRLREINIVMTDIGGDPLLSEGNGGFNARTGMNRFVRAATIEGDGTVYPDYSFSGVWLWHDTNNNGIFDAPTKDAGGGITFNGDYPMTPGSDYFLGSEGVGEWEYVPYPPDGGDPWWKLCLRFSGTRKDTPDDPVEGTLEPVPDNHADAEDNVPWAAEFSNDYFVVIRADSGYQDVSLGPGDGTGITWGADFRIFIEPRRYNSRTGHEDGGIYFDSMIPALGFRTASSVETAWQDDVLWGDVEPWWPQRTLNAQIAKPLKVGMDVHDYAMTYQSESEYRKVTDLFSRFGGYDMDTFNVSTSCFGFSGVGLGLPSAWDAWMDPFDLTRGQFRNGHSAFPFPWALSYISRYDIGGYSFTFLIDDITSGGQFAYETVPFNSVTAPDMDPRSVAYPQPMEQPSLPSYSTWPVNVAPGKYPRVSDWAQKDRRSRLLTQKIDIDSAPTALLGINLCAVNDPIVNARNETSLDKITVAFWGPDFTPSDLQPLDSRGIDRDAGVLLWEDADANGTFFTFMEIENYFDIPPGQFYSDALVPLKNLAWRNAPEPVDLDGDFIADDLNGDGIVDSRDHAWVLTLEPEDLWQVPHQDIDRTIDYGGDIDFYPGGTCSSALSQYSNPRSKGSLTRPEKDAKALELDAVNRGDDLFISIRTSDTCQRFEQIRAVIPATLPGRAGESRVAGIQFYPPVNSAGDAFVKSNPEEEPVQDMFGHDMMMVNVPVKITTPGNQLGDIYIDEFADPVPVLGLDISTNRNDGTLLAGDAGVGFEKGFAVDGMGWVSGQYAGDWLLDSRYETYQITGNSSDELELLSGSPRNGRWRILKNPTFLEEMTVEFYNVGVDADFNPSIDLKPLSIDMETSGVAVYRDNDSNPNNRNGIFDPDIDIPLPLDAAPQFIGQSGENIQVKFVFSTPGTDNVPKALELQRRHRQWVPDTWGAGSEKEFSGCDFFVVVRVSDAMYPGDDFRAGIVSWGPNTPTEPDPDTWARANNAVRDDFAQFREFPWAERGLGFITFFKNPYGAGIEDERPFSYYMDGAKARREPDVSMPDATHTWVRSSTTIKRRSSIFTARRRPLSPTDLVIDSVSRTRIPSQILPDDEFTLVIRGKNFGTSPEVLMTGYNVEIWEPRPADTNITIRIDTNNKVPSEPIILTVRNTSTNKQASRSDLFDLAAGSAEALPKITRLMPGSGTEKDFPVQIMGQNFVRDEKDEITVRFGRTLMRVIDADPAGTWVTVGYPIGGISDTGPLEVEVTNLGNGAFDTLPDGFEFVNKAYQPKAGIMGCGMPRDGGTRGPRGDLVLIALLAAVLAAGYRCRRSEKRK